MNNSINPTYKYVPEKIADIDALFLEITKGNRVALAKGITLIESTATNHRELKNELLKKCAAVKTSTTRIGITGVPGAGKSTLIENLGKLLIANGHKIAVLAIDPSSSKTRGSILGDKTRMQELASKENAFIRPTASSGNLGGTASTTKEVMILCEAAGFDYILVETVGVGQSEILVNDITDVFLLLAVSGTGDELQGIKRGIMEIANIIAINKSDGDNVEKTKQAATQLKNALHLYPVAQNEWSTKVLTISALENTGVEELNNTLKGFIEFQKANGEFEKKREEQERKWLDSYIIALLQNSIRTQISTEKINELKINALKNKSLVFEEIQDIIKIIKNQKE